MIAIFFNSCTTTGIDPIGKENDRYIIDTCRKSDLIIAAWGVNGEFNLRNNYVEKLIGRNAFDLHCLGVSSKGYPRHPLFVRGDVTPILYKKRIFREVIQAIRTKEKSEITSREKKYGIRLKMVIRF